MRDIRDFLFSNERYMHMIIHREFSSKKNTVVYVTDKGKPRVLKWFAPGFKQNMKNEYRVLQEGATKINLPSVYEIDEINNILTLSYVSGENLCGIINDSDATLNEKRRLMILLAEWFIRFHTCFKTGERFRIRGDSILRNFIFNDRIWGVDFEESRMGKPVEDLAEMCTSILTTNPMFTQEKICLCQTFINSYITSAPWTVDKLNEEISHTLIRKIQWRPQQEKTFKQFAKFIQENGLKGK